MIEPASPEECVRALLVSLGHDPERDGLRETPARVARSLREATAGYSQDPREILSRTFDVAYDEMIVVSPIEFWSTCEHHLMPFHGTAAVGYLPTGRVVGLSKIPRLVQCFARRLQVQERMTRQIAEAISEHVNARGVGVIVHARHLCMAARGVKCSGWMRTSCLLGAFRKQATRAEFMHLANWKA